MKIHLLSLTILFHFFCFSQEENITINEFKSTYFIIKCDQLTIIGIPLNIEMFEFEKEYEKLTTADKKRIYNEIKQNVFLHKRIKKWVLIKNTIDLAIENGFSYEYLEFFYKNNDTNHLFKKYLKSKNQDYSSLSSSDSILIYYEIINYLTYANNKKCLSIISEFYKFETID